MVKMAKYKLSWVVTKHWNHILFIVKLRDFQLHCESGLHFADMMVIYDDGEV